MPVHRNQKYRVLIVEDDDDHAELLVSSLYSDQREEPLGIRVTSAEAGLEKAGQEDFDVILLDLSLPDSAPEETLKKFTNRFPTVPIVVMTSLADPELIEQAIKWGAQDYFDKSSMQRESIARALRYAIGRKAALNQLAHQNDALRRFSHTVAHELKNPLQSVVTALHIIEEMGSSNFSEPLKKLLSLGIDSTMHLENLISELLALAESGNEDFELRPVETTKLVTEVIQELRSVYDTSDVTFTIADPLPVVMGSGVRLRQVWNNLIGNAIKYRNDKPLQIVIRAEPIEKEWRFCVSDNGLGIAPEHIEKVFDTFFRVYPRDKIPGTGIGLGFSRDIVQRHGGRMWVESELGHGSHFYFTVPVLGAAESVSPASLRSAGAQ